MKDMKLYYVFICRKVYTAPMLQNFWKTQEQENAVSPNAFLKLLDSKIIYKEKIKNVRFIIVH